MAMPSCMIIRLLIRSAVPRTLPAASLFICCMNCMNVVPPPPPPHPRFSPQVDLPWGLPQSSVISLTEWSVTPEALQPAGFFPRSLPAGDAVCAGRTRNASCWARAANCCSFRASAAVPYTDCYQPCRLLWFKPGHICCESCDLQMQARKKCRTCFLSLVIL